MQTTKIEWTVTRISEPITCYHCHGTGKVKKALETCPTCNGVGEIDTLPGFTYNPWSGCAKVSAGCRTCYAETLSNRFRGEKPSLWGVNAERKPASPMYLLQPHPWNKLAESINERLKVLCASMADEFEDRADGEIVKPAFRGLHIRAPRYGRARRRLRRGRREGRDR